MIVCQCHAVTDREVAAAIAGGAEGLDELACRSGAGARCGGCHETLQALLEAHDSECRAAAGERNAA